MFRAALLVSLAAAAPAGAQISAPWDRPVGVTPYPATPRPAFAPYGGGFGGFGGPGFGYGRPGYGFGYGGSGYEAYASPFYGLPNYGYPGPAIGGGFAAPAAPAPDPVFVGPALDGAHLSSALGLRRAAATAARVTVATTLTIDLPAAGTVTLDGVARPGTSATHTLTRMDVNPGGTATFAVTATWRAGGVAYEYDRTVTLAAGEKQSLVVFRGTPAK